MRLIDASKFEVVYSKMERTDEAYVTGYIDGMHDALKMVDAAPTVDAVPVTRCRDCKHYEVDPFIIMSGVPIIPAHHVCTFWAGGCKTNPEGYCFAGVKKEDEQDAVD